MFHISVLSVSDARLPHPPLEESTSAGWETKMTSSVVDNWGSLILHEVNPTGKEIGCGAYGRVFEVDYEGTVCAAKEVHALLLQYSQGDYHQKIKDDFLSECQIWSTLRHPCVVQFLGSVILVYCNDCY